jgi:hypothetical protein
MIARTEKGNLVFHETKAGTANGLIGSGWHRRTEVGDAYDSVFITGVFQVQDAFELVYQPREFGEALTADSGDFLEVYTKDDETTQQLRELTTLLEEATM